MNRQNRRRREAGRVGKPVDAAITVADPNCFTRCGYRHDHKQQ
ncbi:MAG: hypothetical protein ACR2RB_04315 [Gammaproteobacteria bacterium]